MRDITKLGLDNCNHVRNYKERIQGKTPTSEQEVSNFTMLFKTDGEGMSEPVMVSIARHGIQC